MIWIPLCLFGCTRKWMMVFIMLPSCLNATIFQEGEENQNLTVEWKFLSWESLPKLFSINCYRLTDQLVFLRYHKQGKHISVHQDDEFAGRVRLEEEALREGQIRLCMLRAKVEDSGNYSCTVQTPNEHRNFNYEIRIKSLGHIDINATQKSYHAEKNNNITLEWTFSSTTDCSQNNLYIYCDRLDGKVLFKCHDGVEIPESQDDQFSGRVHHDKDVLREGRIRLHVSRLRTEDSGCYNCKLSIGYCSGADKCNLSVIELHSSVPHPTTISPPTENRGRPGLYVFIIVALFVICGCWKITRNENSERQPLLDRPCLRGICGF